MFYKLSFLGRTEKNFLTIGAHDLDEVKELGSIEEENISLSMDALAALPYLPKIENLILTGGTAAPSSLAQLQGLRIKALMIRYESYEIDEWTIDLSQFPELRYVFASTQHCFRNAAQCGSLQTLRVLQWLEEDLEALSGSNLRALELASGRLRSLKGIEKLPQLVSLSLERQRDLSDLSLLEGGLLESFSLNTCNKTDVNELPYLPQLRLLMLSGRKKLFSLDRLLRKAPALEWLYLDHVVEQGDLSPLLALRHAVIFQDCHHYTMKNKDLPKSSEAFSSPYLPDPLRILPLGK